MFDCIRLLAWLINIRILKALQQSIDHGVVPFFGFIDRQLRRIVSPHVFRVSLVHPTPSDIFSVPSLSVYLPSASQIP